MAYSAGASRSHSMDLRRIVDEVEQRKRYELALAGPPAREARPAQGGGAAGALLLAVRERMLAENPEADVGQIDAVIEPDRRVPPAPAPAAAAARKPDAGKRASAKPHEARPTPDGADDFLDRYLKMSVEFEERYGARGWADFVAKKTDGPARRKAPAAGSTKAPKRGKRKPARRRRP
ncbi:MAG TPA: hypothetical protein VGB42_04130 [Candidatus Thermoplasmatota archaeon]